MASDFREAVRTVRYAMMVFVVLAAFGLFSSACSREQPAQPKITPEQQKHVEQMRKQAEEAKTIAVARVNGHDITMHAMALETSVVAPKRVKPGEQMTPEVREKIRKEALDRLILQQLIVEEAKKQGVSVKPEEVDDLIRKAKASLGGEEQYKEYLKNIGVSDEEFRKMTERHYLSQTMVKREIFDKISVDEKAMKQEYAKHKDLYVKQGNPPVQIKYEEAKPAIEHKLKAELGNRRIEEWGRELKKGAKIEILAEKR